jgi:hypothetical protein
VKAVAAQDYAWKNYFDMQRGPYRIACVMEEGMSDEPLKLTGNFVDLLDTGYPLLKEKLLQPGENTLLFDLDRVKGETVRIIGTSARIFSLEETKSGYSLTCKAADRVDVVIRLKVNKPVFRAEILDEQGMQLKVDTVFDEKSSTVLLCFPSTNQMTTINLTK